MTDIPTKIAEGLEEVFAREGFAEPGVDRLRAAADVSLRTLYKYCPSREDMILTALRHRHRRYVATLFADLPDDPGEAVEAVLDRSWAWMKENSPGGCLFLSAMAAHPASARLRVLIEDYKAEIETKLGEAVGRPELAGRLLLVHEGLTQIRPLRGPAALDAARALALDLVTAGRPQD